MAQAFVMVTTEIEPGDIETAQASGFKVEDRARPWHRLSWVRP
jgi:hypothetical protein